MISDAYGDESFTVAVSGDNAVGTNPSNPANCEMGASLSIDDAPRIQLSGNTSTSGQCFVGLFNFIVDIPVGSTVTGASIEYTMTSVNNGGSTQNTCDWKHVDYATVGGNSASYNAVTLDIGAVTDILQNSPTCHGPVGTVTNIFNTGDFETLFQSDIDGDKKISLGIAYTDMTRSDQDQYVRIDNHDDKAELTITYIPPLQYQIDELESKFTTLNSIAVQNTSDILSLKSFVDSLIILLEGFSTSLGV